LPKSTQAESLLRVAQPKPLAPTGQPVWTGFGFSLCQPKVELEVSRVELGLPGGLFESSGALLSAAPPCCGFALLLPSFQTGISSFASAGRQLAQVAKGCKLCALIAKLDGPPPLASCQSSR